MAVTNNSSPLRALSTSASGVPTGPPAAQQGIKGLHACMVFRSEVEWTSKLLRMLWAKKPIMFCSSLFLGQLRTTDHLL